MINFVKGCKIKDADKLLEEYSFQEDNMIIANVNAEKIIKIIYDFIDMQNENASFFFFLEVPSSLDDENIVKEATDTEAGILESAHKDVYYMDYIPKKVIKEVIEPVKEILINDGFTCFGVGNIETGDEIGKYKYNTMMLHYSNDLQKYENIFIDNGIVKNQEMIMAEDIINKNNPGECEIYTGKDGRNIYDIVDAFKETFEEFYKAEKREE